MPVNSSATFDILYIASSTKRSYPDLGIYELNFLSYFACLMSLYDGNPTAEWEYSFYKNENGAPVSSAIADAVKTLSECGEMKEFEKYFGIMPEGEISLEVYKGLSLFKKRMKYLDAACDCLLTDSIVSLASTLSLDPVIKESTVHSLKMLNSDDNDSLASLHFQFDVIREIVGLQKELFVPAHIWIQYLKLSNKDDIGRPNCEITSD